jgi:hypothetical protein
MTLRTDPPFTNPTNDQPIPLIAEYGFADHGIAAVRARRTIGCVQDEPPRIEAARAKTRTAPDKRRRPL